MSEPIQDPSAEKFERRRRREDQLEQVIAQLEDLLEHGSKNFRRYRRKAYAAFALLAVANAFAIFWVADTRDDTTGADLQRQKEIAALVDTLRDQTIQNKRESLANDRSTCLRGNDTRDVIRSIAIRNGVRLTEEERKILRSRAFVDGKCVPVDEAG